MRVLIVEDDAATQQAIELMLCSEGFTTYCTVSGAEAVDLAKLYDYDAITLDQTEPLRAIRRAKVKSAIIVVSGLSAIGDKVSALDSGADDYLTKPFHKDELVARLHSIIRRSRGHVANVVTIGDVAINLDQKTVTVRGEPVHLTGKEYGMLQLLALRKDVLVSKEAFLIHLYDGRDDEPDAKIIDVFICKLRKKVPGIETIWGRGFMMRDPTTPIVKSPSITPEIDDAPAAIFNTGMAFDTFRVKHRAAE